MARHLVPFAAFFAQVQLQPPVLHIDILDPHREHRPNAGEREHHRRAVA
nr:hypothetical protein [Paraburkholderia aspalathi]